MTIRLETHSKGYRMLRIDGDDLDGDGPRYVQVHRLVLYARGVLDSPRFEDDPREVHHVDGTQGHNGPDNLDALSPGAHGATTRARDGSQDDGNRPETVGTDYGPCGACSRSRPRHVREDGSRRCVVCRTVVDVPDVEIDDEPEVEEVVKA